MSPIALGLVLAAALMHATWNLAAKRSGGGGLFLLLCSLVSVVLLAVPVAIVVARDGLPRDPLAWAVITGTSVLHFVYSSSLQRAYRVAELSVVYPVARGTGPMLSLLLATTLLGERPGPQALVGGLTIVLGVFWLAGGGRLLREHDARTRLGLRWGLGIGALIASYTIVDAYAVRTLAVAPLVLEYGSNLLRIGLFGTRTWSSRGELWAEWRRTWRYVLVVAVLGPLGYVLVLSALHYAPVSYVAPARELSMLVGAFFGARLLDEGETGRRVLGAAIIAVGVMLIALS